MIGDNDWDLYAVVRSCNNSGSATSSTAAATRNNNNQNATPMDTNSREDALSCLASLSFDEQDQEEPNDVAFSFTNIFHQPNVFHELQQAYMSFLPPTARNNTSDYYPPPPVSTPHNTNFRLPPPQDRHFRPTSIITPPQPQMNMNHHHHPPGQAMNSSTQTQMEFVNVNSPPMTQLQTPRSRKRKNQQKRIVCHVTEENLSTDVWAWRKYGQKPIKGSPYPRNYYRCSSSKGCAARKQVERSIADPETFVVTYAGDHTHPRPTHRNSLAGSSRNKLICTKNNPMGIGDFDQSSINSMAGSFSSPASPTTPLVSRNEEDGAKAEAAGAEGEKEGEEDMAAESEGDGDGADEEEEEEDDILIPNLTMRDEIFVGFEQLGCTPK